jgi:hypothetical protein
MVMMSMCGFRFAESDDTASRGRPLTLPAAPVRFMRGKPQQTREQHNQPLPRLYKAAGRTPLTAGGNAESGTSISRRGWQTIKCAQTGEPCRFFKLASFRAMLYDD